MISIILPNELIPSVKLKVKMFLFPLSFSNRCSFANRNYYFLHYDTFIRWILTLCIDGWIANILNCCLCKYATSILRTRKTKKIFFFSLFSGNLWSYAWSKETIFFLCLPGFKKMDNLYFAFKSAKQYKYFGKLSVSRHQEMLICLIFWPRYFISGMCLLEIILNMEIILCILSSTLFIIIKKIRKP